MRSERVAMVVCAALSAGCTFEWDQARARVERVLDAGSAPMDVAVDAPRDRADVVDVRVDVVDAAVMDVVDVTAPPIDRPVDVVDVVVPMDRMGVDAPAETGVDAPADRAIEAAVDAPIDVPVDLPPACTTMGSACPCSPSNRGGYCSPGGACNTAGVCAMGSPEGSLIITEIMSDPQTVMDDVGEWFEVYNPGTTPLDLRGVRISNSRSQMVTITSLTPVVVDPTRYAVLARNGMMSTNGGVTALYVYGVGLGASTLAWSNSSTDAVILDLGSMATEIDHVTYNPVSGSPWPRAMGKAKSLRGAAINVTANDLPANWCDAPTQWVPMTGDFGSPGVANPPCP